MKAFHEGQLVRLVAETGEHDAIVVHSASLVKVEVAIADAEHGALFRTVHPKTLKERSEPGEHDDALRHRIRRTAAPGSAGVRGGRRGHTKVSGHRTTGK